MSFDTLLTHRLLVRNYVVDGTDTRYNNDVPEVDTELETPGRVDVVAADEELRDRDQDTQRFIVFLPPDVVVRNDSELDWLDEDITLKADGPPLRTDDAIGAHHLELFAYRIRG